MFGRTVGNRTLIEPALETSDLTHRGNPLEPDNGNAPLSRGYKALVLLLN